ncbi:MAG: hypothetical protein IKV52_01050 [Oscillospiraceae bacterium]|nr:hypothetical protein [Oscillospiraceae bacterium]
MKKRLTLFLYIAMAVLFVVQGVVHFAYDRITMPSQQTLDISEFEVLDMKQTGENTFVSVTNDPQFVLIDSTKYRIHTVKYTLAQPCSGAKCIYYANDRQPQFSGKNMIIAEENGTTTVEYILPMNKTNRIRLDVTGDLAQIIVVDEIIINFRPSFFRYFDIDTMTVAKFLVIPPILVSVIMYVVELFFHYIRKQETE